MADLEPQDLTVLTVELLSAYVSNNQLESGLLASLIETTRNALAGKTAAEEVAAPEFVAAITVRKSLGSRDHILSMIDGKPYKSLKRHLAAHGLTPADYRARYGLAKDYPMVAPGYSEQRREVAKRLGLGRRPAAAAETAPVSAAPERAQTPVDEPAVAPAKSARRSAAPAKVSAAPGAITARGAKISATKALRGRSKALTEPADEDSDSSAALAPTKAAPAKAERAAAAPKAPKASSGGRAASKPAPAEAKPAVRRRPKSKAAVEAPGATGEAD